MAKIVRVTWTDPSPTTNVNHLEIWRSTNSGAAAQVGTDLALGVETYDDDNGGSGFNDADDLDYSVRAYNSTGQYSEVTGNIVISSAAGFPDITSYSYASDSYDYATNLSITKIYGFGFNAAKNAGIYADVTTGSIFNFSLGTAGTISTFSKGASENTTPTVNFYALHANADGTDNLVVDTTGKNQIQRYTGTSFLPATYSKATEVSPSIGTTIVSGVWENSARSRVYAARYTGLLIECYTEDTPGDLSTMNTGTKTSIDLSGISGATIVYDIFLSDDESKLFAAVTEGTTGCKIHQWNIGTPGNLSTASYVGALDVFSTTGSTVRGIWTDGTNMYLASFSNGFIYRFDAA